MRHLTLSDCLYVSRAKGLIWLSLATIAEVPPVVSPIPLLFFLFLTHTHLLS